MGSRRIGRLLIALGAVWLLASLFMPWYGAKLSADVGGIHGKSFTIFFLIGPVAPDGWETLGVIDIYVAAVAGLALFGCGASLRRPLNRFYGATAIGAIVAVGLITYRLVEPALRIRDDWSNLRLPSEFTIFGTRTPPAVSVYPRLGIYVALASALAIVIGSALAAFGSGRLQRFLPSGDSVRLRRGEAPLSEPKPT